MKSTFSRAGVENRKSIAAVGPGTKMEYGRMVMVTGSQPCPALGGLAIHSVHYGAGVLGYL